MEQLEYTFRESDKLTLRGGYMIVHEGDCHITINAKLSEGEKEIGLMNMLSQRDNLDSQNSGIYIWCVDNDHDRRDAR